MGLPAAAPAGTAQARRAARGNAAQGRHCQGAGVRSQVQSLLRQGRWGRGGRLALVLLLRCGQEHQGGLRRPSRPAPGRSAAAPPPAQWPAGKCAGAAGHCRAAAPQRPRLALAACRQRQRRRRVAQQRGGRRQVLFDQSAAAAANAEAEPKQEREQGRE